MEAVNQYILDANSRIGVGDLFQSPDKSFFIVCAGSQPSGILGYMLGGEEKGKARFLTYSEFIPVGINTKPALDLLGFAIDSGNTENLVLKTKEAELNRDVSFAVIAPFQKKKNDISWTQVSCACKSRHIRFIHELMSFIHGNSGRSALTLVMDGDEEKIVNLINKNISG